MLYRGKVEYFVTRTEYEMDDGSYDTVFHAYRKKSDAERHVATVLAVTNRNHACRIVDDAGATEYLDNHEMLQRFWKAA